LSSHFPKLRVEVVRLAVHPVSVIVPSVLFPSLKVTVPEGAPTEEKVAAIVGY